MKKILFINILVIMFCIDILLILLTLGCYAAYDYKFVIKINNWLNNYKI